MESVYLFQMFASVIILLPLAAQQIWQNSAAHGVYPLVASKGSLGRYKVLTAWNRSSALLRAVVMNATLLSPRMPIN